MNTSGPTPPAESLLTRNQSQKDHQQLQLIAKLFINKKLKAALEKSTAYLSKIALSRKLHLTKTVALLLSLHCRVTAEFVSSLKQERNASIQREYNFILQWFGGDFTKIADDLFITVYINELSFRNPQLLVWI